MGPSSLPVPWGWGVGGTKGLEQQQSQAAFPCLYVRNQRERGQTETVPYDLGESNWDTFSRYLPSLH